MLTDEFYNENFSSLEVIECDDIVRINYFYLKKESRNKGIGSEAMIKITAYSDQVGKALVLRATNHKNKRFYKRHGFSHGWLGNTCNRDNMYRIPNRQ